MGRPAVPLRSGPDRLRRQPRRTTQTPTGPATADQTSLDESNLSPQTPRKITRSSSNLSLNATPTLPAKTSAVAPADPVSLSRKGANPQRKLDPGASSLELRFQNVERKVLIRLMEQDVQRGTAPDATDMEPTAKVVGVKNGVDEKGAKFKILRIGPIDRHLLIQWQSQEVPDAKSGDDTASATDASAIGDEAREAKTSDEADEQKDEESAAESESFNEQSTTKLSFSRRRRSRRDDLRDIKTSDEGDEDKDSNSQIESEVSVQDAVTSNPSARASPRMRREGLLLGRTRGKGKSPRGRPGQTRGVAKAAASTPRKRALREAASKILTEVAEETGSAQTSLGADDKSEHDTAEEEQASTASGNVEHEDVTIPDIITTEAQDDNEAQSEEQSLAQSIEKPSPVRPSLTRQNSGASALRSRTHSVELGIMEKDIMDLDLPPPYVENYKKPTREECIDEADYIEKTMFKPLTDSQAFIDGLTKYPASERSTEVLYALVANAQRTLVAWQDEYLKLDAITAPESNPAKKPCTGGRQPVAPAIFEQMKEADLYNYAYDPKKEGWQDPYGQRIGRDTNAGRELRNRRRPRDVIGSAQVSEEEDANEGVGKRRRRAVNRYEGTATPEVGTRSWRKRAAGQDGELEAGDTDRVSKRARTTATGLPARVREMRGESVLHSSTEGEGTPEPSGSSKRRGRPPGSKNLQRRSDAGIKKGPRKPAADAASPGDIGEEPETFAAPGVRFASDGLKDDGQDGEQAAPPRAKDAPANGKVAIPAQALEADGSPAKRKQRAKSEKRSASMKIWWDKRKEKQEAERKAEDEKQHAAAAAAASEAASLAPSTHPLPPQPPPMPKHIPGGQIMTHTSHSPPRGTPAPPPPPPPQAYPLTGNHIPPQQMHPQPPPPPHLQGPPMHHYAPAPYGHAPPPMMHGPPHHPPPPMYYHHGPQHPGPYLVHHPQGPPPPPQHGSAPPGYPPVHPGPHYGSGHHP